MGFVLFFWHKLGEWDKMRDTCFQISDTSGKNMCIRGNVSALSKRFKGTGSDYYDKLLAFCESTPFPYNASCYKEIGRSFLAAQVSKKDIDKYCAEAGQTYQTYCQTATE